MIAYDNRSRKTTELASLLYDYVNNTHKEDDLETLANDCRELLNEILIPTEVIEKRVARTKEILLAISDEDVEKILRGAL